MGRRGSGLVVLCSHGIQDALVAPLMLDYLLRLQALDKARQVLLFTEERDVPVLPARQLERFSALRITWVPLEYRVEGRQWLQKVRIAFRVLRLSRRFLRPFAQRTLLGYLSFAGSYAVLLKCLGYGKCVTVCFEPHSLYMLEMGVWGRNSLKFRVTRYLERMQMRHADELVVPTTAVRDHVMAAGRQQEPVLQGITIEVGQAAFNGPARERIRKAHGFGSDQVIAYVGKFGGIYHGVDAYLAFVEQVATAAPWTRFLIITQQEWVQVIEAHPARQRLADRLVVIPPVPPAELPAWLSAADLGVIAVPPTSSQAFRTPVKTAYYWAAGLPIIIPKGVSDDHWIAEREDVGIVIDDLPLSDPVQLAGALSRYRSEEATEVRRRCMAAALRHRDTAGMVTLLQRVLA